MAPVMLFNVSMHWIQTEQDEEDLMRSSSSRRRRGRMRDESKSSAECMTHEDTKEEAEEGKPGRR